MLIAHFECVPTLSEVSHFEVTCVQQVPLLWDTRTLGTDGFIYFSPERGCVRACVRMRTRTHQKHSVPSVPFQSKKQGTLCGTLAFSRLLVSHPCAKGGCLHA